MALFLLVIFVVPLLVEPAATLALSASAPNSSSAVDNQSPPALKPVPAKNKPAVDTSFGTAAATTLGLNSPLTSGDTLSSPRTLTKSASPTELVSKRSATSDTRLNADGTMTQRQYTVPHYFKNGTDWQKIDTSIIEDTNAADSSNVVGKLLGKAESLVRKETTFTVKANDWKARFAPSDSANGMVAIQDSSSRVDFSPVQANAVNPVVVTDKTGQQAVWYYNLWSGVDVQYVVSSTGLKENIMLNSSQATRAFAFTVKGAQMVAVNDPKTTTGSLYKLKGALNDQFSISQFVISLNKYGLEARQPITQSVNGNQLNVSIDGAYLKALPADAFPLTLDPSFTRSFFGSRAGGNYMSFKSDGYVCYSDVCNPYAGEVLDSNGYWQAWRGLIGAPYTFLQGKVLTNANLHLTQRLGLPNSGSPVDRYFTAAHGTCFNFNCVGIAAPNWSLINTVGDINVTNIYQSRIAAGDWGAWLMILGEEYANTTYKNWDPDNSFVDFTYSEYTPTPSIVTPANNQTFVDPQVSLQSTTPANPNTGTPLKYNFCVSTSQYCAGTVVNSGDLTSNQWTVPDGVLQDGSSYYVQVRALDPDGGGGYSGWSSPVMFRVDMRRGKDKTQSYDTVGPVDIDLATGNLSTSNASHTSSALGGSLGVSLDYNSPLRSRNGLVGEYFTNNTLSGSPALTRVDSTVNFNWGSGSPSPTIPSDNFSSRWTGYFVAPTTGSYSFGASGDDGTRITVNGQVVENNWQPGAWPLIYGSAVTLTAGQVVPILVEYYEVNGGAYDQLYVKGAVAEQIVPKEWLQTGARPMTQQSGLTGHYYNLTPARDLNAAGLTNFLTRTDPILSMNWDVNSPIPGGATDFMARWTGYITLPTAGTYSFGTLADDGSRISIDGATVMDNWTGPCCSLIYGNAVQMSAGTHSITVDMYDTGGPATMYLYTKGAVAEQVVPSSWLSTKAQVLPDGWNLGVDPDGNLSYDRLYANASSVTLADSTGDTHEYTWTGSGYKPPVNEDGYLVRNGDGTFTLNDSDGKTYVFSSAGVLTSVTMPVDDLHPSALSYSYAGSPAKITQISDGVDPSRNAKVYYSGDSACGSAPSGFDSNAPTGMLCAVVTNDGRATYFYYLQGYLSRIVKPGNETTDYQYDTLGRIVAVRDSVANDAVNAGLRVADNSVLTQISYDSLGRASAVTAPAATTGATAAQQTFEYLPGTSSYTGATQEHVTGDSEPNGYSRRIEYDSIFRTTKDSDVAALTTIQDWDPVKDLLFASTDATGLKSTTLYDTDDRPTDSYGPAPAAWYGTDNRPLPAYDTQVPHNTNAYDENISGLAVAWNKVDATTGSLMGAPVAHSTGINPTVDTNWLGRDFNSNPLPASYNLGTDFGFSATGKMSLPSSGLYSFKLYHDDGARLWIDDQLIFDDWSYRSTGTAQNAPTGYFNATAGQLYRFRLDYAHFGTPGALELWVGGPGIVDTNNGMGTSKPTFIKPGYGLQTSNTTYDAQLGNTVNRTNYGSNPELGLATSSSQDATGLNLTTTSTYESPGPGSYLRALSSSLPGGATTNNAYYSATQTMDNPCTSTVEAYKQGGQVRLKTDPDPDGSGPLTGRTTESIYDDSGAVIASRYNSDPWTCNTLDARGRTTSSVIPAYGTIAGRTITNNYVTGNNPLITTSTDATGSLVVQTDLLGRVIKYTDTKKNVTTSSYDAHGRLVQRVSKMGTEDYVYDQYDRLVDQKFNNIVYAHVTYDQYSRINDVTYQNGLKLSSMTRDNLGRINGLNYSLANSQTLSDQVTRATTGDIMSGVELGTNKQYTYDTSGRLTAATIGSNSFAYSYGAQSSTCGTATNPNAGKDSNRMSQTINGKTTTYCYDYADRLTKSSDPIYTAATYDTHGNVKALGTAATKTTFGYDSSDRLLNINEASKSLNVVYKRDIQGRIITRTEKQGAVSSVSNYGYTASGDTPDFITDSANKIAEEYLSLPGGVTLTIRPQSSSASVQTWSLPNIHGDVFATIDADGSLSAKSLTGPFGEVLAGQQRPMNLTGSATYSYLGQHQKQTEAGFSVQPIDMGARTYLPGLGRFAQMDPIKGGTPNDYMYVSDPINDFDLSGQSSHWRGLTQIGIFAVATVGTAAACAATAGLGCVVAAAAIGAASSAGSNVAGQVKNGKRFDKKSLALDTALGGALGAVGGRGLGSQNNIARAAHGRVSLGPAPVKYNTGRISSRIPVHVHMEWKKAGINFPRSGGCRRLWGRWRC